VSAAKPSKAKLAAAAEVLNRHASTVDLATERSKPRVLSLLFCDFASFTIDKKVNLLGIFDRIFVHPEKKQTPIFTLFIRTAETIEERLTVTLFRPDGKPGLGFQFGGQKQTYTPNLPAQIQLLIGLQFVAEIEGAYWFDVSYKEKSIGGAGLVVEYRTEQKEHGTDTYV
jgi:hypothetical protein